MRAHQQQREEDGGEHGHAGNEVGVHAQVRVRRVGGQVADALAGVRACAGAAQATSYSYCRVTTACAAAVMQRHTRYWWVHQPNKVTRLYR